MKKTKSIIASILLLAAACGMAQDVNLYLNGQWELSYWKQPQKPVCSPEEMAAVKYKTIPATVPGNVEIDLMKAGYSPSEASVEENAA